MDNTQQVSSNLGLNWSSSSLLKICCGPARQLWGAALAALHLWKATATPISAQIGLNLLDVVYMPNTTCIKKGFCFWFLIGVYYI